MRPTLDLAPLLRSGIGFDRVFDLLENASQVPPIDNWPPYDIARFSDDRYRITMAVAGFSENELTITHEPNTLVIAGRDSDDEGGGQYLHRGITGRAFQRRFQLADHVNVLGASLANGLLTIELKREVPEEMKPRRITIASGEAAPGGQASQFEAGKQAA